MYFDISYDGHKVKKVILKLDVPEDPDKLHEYACLLKVKNPAIMFAERVKAGELNELSDEEYEAILNKI